MPSTYTLNNGIELIATGEQSGTWGDTTNTNLSLVDTALDGQVTVTLPSAGTSGSPNTLAISDGAASDGRNRMVIFNDGGDLGATAYVQLTPNDAEKIIYVRNDLAGSRSIILFQGTYSASNDYEVPAGTTAVVYFNGAGSGAVAANVFNNVYFDSLRLGSVSVTAILDEDDMSSDSATSLATQQSIKAYVDTQVGANNELSEVLANGNTTGGTDIAVSANDDITFTDSSKAIFGGGSDLQIYHDGSASYIVDNGTGNLRMQGVIQVADDPASNDGRILYGDSTTAQGIVHYDFSEGDFLFENTWANAAAEFKFTTNSVNSLTVSPAGLNVLGEVQIDGANNASDVNNVLRFKDTDTAVVADQKIGRIEFETSDTSNPGVNLQIDGIYGGSGAGSELVIYTGVAGSLENRMFIQDVETVFNDDGGDNDFRVESSSDAYALFVNAGTSRVGINESSPSHALDVTSTAQVAAGFTGSQSGISYIKITNSATSAIGVGSAIEFRANTSTTERQVGFIQAAWTDNTDATRESSMRLFNNKDGGNRSWIDAGPDEVVINEGGADVDFRVETGTNANAIYLDSTNGRLGLFTGGPLVKFQIGAMSGSNTSKTAQASLLESTGFTLNFDTGTNTAGSTHTINFIDRHNASGTGADGQVGALIQAARNGSSSSYSLKMGAVSDNSADAVGDLALYGGGMVVNDNGASDFDFQVKAGSYNNAILVDAGTGEVNFDGARANFGGTAADSADGEVNVGLLKFRNSNTTSGEFLSIDCEGTTAAQSMIHYWYDGAYRNRFEVAGNKGATVVNESGLDVDFRVESDNVSYMFHVDAANDTVAVGTNTPGGRFSVHSGSYPQTNEILTEFQGGFTAGTYDQTRYVKLKQSFTGAGYESPALVFESNANASNQKAYGVIYTKTGGALSFNNKSAGTAVAAGTAIGATERFQLGTSAAVFNEPSNDYDFRIESNALNYCFGVDGGTNTVQIGTSRTGSDAGYTSMMCVMDMQGNKHGLEISNPATANSYRNLILTSDESDAHFLQFNYGTSEIGGIDGDGTTGVIYSTTSDRRLKTDIRPINEATNKLMAMKPVTHKWKEHPEKDFVHGFIAQEMLEIVPEAVSGTPDGEEMMSMDYGRITPVIVAALQEANKKIAELEARIATLEEK